MAHPFLAKALRCIVPALFFLLAGCSSSTQFYREVENDLGAGRYSNAIDRVTSHRKDYGDKSTVIYNMDLGILYH